MTGSATSFATNLICSILPRTLIAPFAGYVADNYSRKTIVITAQIATTLAIGGLLAVSLTSGLSLIAIYITTCILSLTSTFSGVTFTSSITGLVDESRIQKAMSMNQMSISFAAIGSPAVGGLLYGTVTMPVFLIMFMAASIIAVILESTMNFKLFAKRKEVVVGEAKETMIQSMKAGLVYLKLQPIIITIVWISLFINFLFGAFRGGLFIHSHREIENGVNAFRLHARGVCSWNAPDVNLLVCEKRNEVPTPCWKTRDHWNGFNNGGNWDTAHSNHALLRHVRSLCNTHVRFRTDDDYCQYTAASDDAKND